MQINPTRTADALCGPVARDVIRSIGSRHRVVERKIASAGSGAGDGSLGTATALCVRLAGTPGRRWPRPSLLNPCTG